MLDLLKKLCELDAPSGSEHQVRDFILNEIKDYAECSVDSMGNIIAFKKGAKTPDKKIMIDAHMDEVGFIITEITDKGFLKFSTLGGIETAVILSKKVLIGENKVPGIISAKAIHLQKRDEELIPLKICSVFFSSSLTIFCLSSSGKR